MLSRKTRILSYALFFLFLHLSQIIFLAIFTPIFPYFLIYFIVIFYIGTRMRALGNIIHECSHRIFTENKKWDLFLGRVLASLHFSSFREYQHAHFSHHRFTGDQEKDEDAKSRYCIGIFSSFSLKKTLLKSLSPLNWSRIEQYQIFDFREPFWVNGIRLLYLHFFLFFSISSLSFFLFITIPFLTSYPFMKIFSDLMDHGGLLHKKAIFARSRNHFFKIKYLNLLLFPRNDGYHLLHHLYPQLPVRKYKEKHDTIINHDYSYQERTLILSGAHFWNEILKIFVTRFSKNESSRKKLG